MKIHKKYKKISNSVFMAIGVVLVWRGIWHALDIVDVWLFGGSHFWTSIAGFVLGLLILYLPDKDLKEVEKL